MRVLVVTLCRKPHMSPQSDSPHTKFSYKAASIISSRRISSTWSRNVISLVPCSGCLNDTYNRNKFFLWNGWSRLKFFVLTTISIGWSWSSHPSHMRKIGRAHAELQSRGHLVCRLLLEIKNYFV